MFIRHRHGPIDKLNCPHAMGTNTFSPQWPKSFRHLLLLPSPSLVYNRRKLPNLRVSLGARTAQLQASCLRVRSHAGACPPPAQRTATGYAGRCVEGAEARSISALDSKNGWPTQARFWLEWGTAFLAKAVLRFQHSKLSAVCGEAALYSPKSGQARVMRASGGLAVEQLPPLRNRR